MTIKNLSKENAEILQGWLHDDRVSALEDDPSVGIYASPELADAFQDLMEYVEEQTGVAAPVNGK